MLPKDQSFDPTPSSLVCVQVPSCFNKSTEGSFTITVMAQTHGIKISCMEVNKLEDQLIHAMKSVDRDWTDDRDENTGLVEIGALMDRVDELDIESDVVEQGRRCESVLLLFNLSSLTNG